MKNKQKPVIQFEKNKENWKEIKAGSIFYSLSDKNHPNLPLLSASQEKGMVFRDQIGIDIQYNVESTKNYKRVVPGQFVIHLRSFQGGFAFSAIEGITSPAYTVLDFKNKEEQDVLFWKNVFSSKTFIKKLESVTYGIRDGRSISFSDFSTLKFIVPNYEAQKKIGTFFKDLDDIISLHQQELEALKQTKQGFLQKMFPREGQLIPMIRFNEFKDNWAKKLLEQKGKLRSGIGFSEIEQGGTEGIPFYKVSDMNHRDNKMKMKIANNYVTDQQIKSKKWSVIEEVPAIIFAKVGAALMLNRKKLVTTSFLIDNNLMSYSFNSEWDSYFGYTLFQTIFLPKYAQVGALPSFNISDVSNIEILLPSYNEQVKIGKFFRHLDEVIELKEQELEALIQTKKGFLQKMFV